tara:strand:- start:34673 stop:36805 length:2133 start_codon:yes stop_codon:yes gene_type:complete
VRLPRYSAHFALCIALCAGLAVAVVAVARGVEKKAPGVAGMAPAVTGATGAGTTPPESEPVAQVALLPPVSGERPSRMPPRPLAWAMQAAQDGDWARAAEVARRDGPAAVALIEWQRLRAGLGSPDEVERFLTRHGDWPGLDLLRRRSEAGMANATPEQIIAFYDGRSPTTGTGVIALAAALRARGAATQADGVIVKAWQTMPLTESDEAALYDAQGDLLRIFNRDRMEMLFWEGQQEDLDRMKPRVGERDWALAQARRLARVGAPGTAEAIAALPVADRKDAALVYGRFKALVAVGKTEQARLLMRTQSRIEGGLGRPEAWANERRIYAREEMRRGDNRLAYDLAAHHQLTEGSDFADLEWLAGFIALRKLAQPRVALNHFLALANGVETPISLGRAYYWMGRAYEDLGEAEQAKAAYTEGARHQTSYYGLLAAERAGVASDPALGGQGPLADWQVPEITGSLLREASALLLAAGQPIQAEMFLMQMADVQSVAGLNLMGAMLESRNDAHMQVMLGKRAAGRGIVLPRYYYALHPLAQMTLPVAPELALAIARRESEFDIGVSSGAGAGGLMQLMPGTAKEVARNLGIDDHDQARLLSDWRHNATLGSAYLAQLARRFSGNVVLIAVGYNAGPGRAEQWIDLFGDPRDPEVDVVDWVETIPYRETRNYVQRVAESLPVYRARLGVNPRPVPFSAELGGSTLLPLSPESE